jgi:phosphatidylinositol alpha-1,6-mannosyltransferase
VFCDSWKSAEALPRELKARAAVLAHGAEFPPDASARKARRIVDALSGVSCVIANSRFTAEAVRRALPVGEQPRIEIVNPPYVPADAASADALARIRAAIAGRAPVLCTLARLEPRKGVDRIIAALPEIAARHPGVVFLVGGAGPDEDRLRTLAREKNVEGRVVFLGRVGDAEKSAMFASADLFVMPVRREGTSVEGFGIVYMEAAGFGLPALGGLDGGAADAVVDGETGLLCDGRDQAAVTAALLRLLDNDEARAAMGAAAKTRAMGEFTWKAQLPRYLAAAGIVAS